MKNIVKKLLVTSALIVPVLSHSQVVWNETGGNPSWSDTANWTPAILPTSTSAVEIAGTTTGIIGVDTGTPVTVGSFAFTNSLDQATEVLALGTESLQVNGNIVNLSSFAQTFSLAVTAGASSNWTGPLSFSNIVSLGTFQITLTDNVAFSGSTLNFDITNTSTYGRFLGAGTASVSGVFIDLGGSYTGVLGNTFDLTTGNFSGATLRTLPTLNGGLSWDSSNFLANGTLTVIPEPNTWFLVGIGLVSIMILRRRHSRA